MPAIRRRKHAPIWPGILFGMGIPLALAYFYPHGLPRLMIEKQSADESDIAALVRTAFEAIRPKRLP